MKRVGTASAVAAFALSFGSAATAQAGPIDRPREALREIVTRRTAFSRTWSMPDGKRITRIGASRVNWRDSAGRLQPLDVRMHRNRQGFDAEVGGAELRLPGRLGGSIEGAITLVDGDDVVSIWIEGLTGEAQRTGDSITYRAAHAATDVRVHATPEGIKEEVVLNRPSAPRQLSYRLQASAGLDARVAASGSVEITRGSRTVFTIPRGFAYEERRPVIRHTLPAYQLDSLGGGAWRLRLDADGGWIRDASRSWPVIVDPTVTIDRLTGTSVAQLGSVAGLSCGPPGSVLVIGVNQYECAFRAAFRFGGFPAPILDDLVSGAKMHISTLASTAINRRVAAHAITQAWTAPSPPPWSAHDPTPLGTATLVASAGIDVDVSRAVRRWHLRAVDPSMGRADHGLLLKLTDEIPTLRPDAEVNYCGPYDGMYFCEDEYVEIADPAYPDVAKRPYLDVYTATPAQAGSQVELPFEGQMTSRFVELRAEATSENIATARFEYFTADQGEWQDVPLSALRFKSTGAAPTSTSVAVTDQRSARLIWDLQRTPGGQADGPVRVRAVLDSGVAVGGGFTPERNFRIDRKNPASSTHELLGPGRVDLLTGDYVIAATDADIPAFLTDLLVSRTYHSRGGPPRTTDLFGPGWQANVEADGGEMPYRSVYDFTEVTEEQELVDWVLNTDAIDWEYFDPADLTADPVYKTNVTETHYAVLELADGSKVTFRKEGSEWKPDAAHPGLAMTTSGSARVVTAEDGGVATFEPDSAGAPNFRPVSYVQAGSRHALSYQYETVNGRRRLKRVVAPTPSGVTCTGSTLANACRSLELTWTTVRTPQGDVTRVDSIAFVGTDPSAQVTVNTRIVADYDYDANGRLTRVTDPRVPGLWTQYSYDARGRLTTVTPAGERSWTVAYTSAVGDESDARLRSVTRKTPAGADATWRVAYDVPLSGSTAPHDLGWTAVAAWGQTDRPVTGTAIFPPDTVPAATPTSWRRARVHYLGSHGQMVNVASAEGDITTTEYDKNGNVVRELTAGNRVRALEARDSAARSAFLDTQFVWDPANAVDLRDQIGPERVVTRPNGDRVVARPLTRTIYDVGAPRTGGPFHLPTETRRGAMRSADGVVIDEEVTAYEYADGTNIRGWEVRRPLKTIRSTGTGTLVEEQAFHPNHPLRTQHRSPDAAGTDPNVTNYFYNGVNAGSVGSAWCPDDADLAAAGTLCAAIPAAQPASGPAMPGQSFELSYLWGAYRTRDLTSSGSGVNVVRTTTTTSDLAGRTTRAVVSGPGAPVPVITSSYSSTTGRLLTTSSAAIGTDPSRTITRSYDDNGRLVRYTDADGGATTYAYDLNGRLASVSDSQGTRTLAYNDRDLIAEVDDSTLSGPVEAEYDADGALTRQLLPNGLEATIVLDEGGAERSVAWVDGDGCATACEWVASSVERDAQGRVVRQSSRLSEQTLSYDGVGRLASVRDQRAAICRVRAYSYDRDSNRVGRSERTSVFGGACGTGALTTTALVVDDADRVIDSGFAYDDLGRTTSVPAAHAGGSGVMSNGYAADDLVTRIEAGSRTQDVLRDPLRRVHATVTAASDLATLSRSVRYSSDADEPTAIVAGLDWERAVRGPANEMLAISTPAGAVFQLTDVHGDVVATAPDNRIATAPTRTQEYDEFGGLAWASRPSATTDLNAGWLGGMHKRTAFGNGGPVHMGARLYLPSLGRFLQVDPVERGSWNDYDYAFQDPLNVLDLDGRQGIKCPNGKMYWNGAPPSCQRYLRNRRAEANRMARRDGLAACRAIGALMLFTPGKIASKPAGWLLRAIGGGQYAACF